MLAEIVCIALLVTTFCDGQQLPQDPACSSRQATIDVAIRNGSNFHNFYVFVNESLSRIDFTWGGANTNTLILVMSGSMTQWSGSRLVSPSTANSSMIYRSTDGGKSYVNITDQVSKTPIYVLTTTRNPRDPLHIILYGQDSQMKGRTWYTVDGGANWQSWKPTSALSSLDFDGVFHFATHEDVPSKYVLAYSQPMQALYVSSDGGDTFKKIGDNVVVFSWGRSIDPAGTVYRLSGNRLPQQLPNGTVIPCCTLQRSVNVLDTNSWQTISTGVFNFIVLSRFLYFSVVLGHDYSNERALFVYTKIGDANVVRRVNLPTATPDRFFSVLDVDDEQAFVHVDEPGKTGRGTLYVSDTTGSIFSESLRNHFHADADLQPRVTDFVKIASMRGVYFTSELLNDSSLVTRATFTRGAEWLPLRQPSNVNCSALDGGANSKEPCALQIALQYAMQRGIEASPLLSSENARGLIIAHGHTDRVAQDGSPDVYLSIDGGYGWRRAFMGSHYYAVSNSGSVLVALEWAKRTTLKYSLDYGQCWHEYSFAASHQLNDFNVTGIVTEPGNRALSVAVWGYSESTAKWGVHVFDFAAILSKTCTADDYETWTAHTELYSDVQNTESQACLLGKRETFYRLKRNSWCANDYAHNQTSSSQVCSCTMADYDCEYGHYRPTTKSECVLLNGVAEADLCIADELQRADSAYRKIPGDVCVGGFTPAISASFTDLRRRCNEDKRSGVTLPSVEMQADPSAAKASAKPQAADVERQMETVASSRSRNVLLAIFFCVFGLLVLFGLAISYRVMMRRRFARHRGAYKYRPLSGEDGRNDEQSQRLVDDDNDDPIYERDGHSDLNVAVQVRGTRDFGRTAQLKQTAGRDGSSSNSSNNDEPMLTLDNVEAGANVTNNLNLSPHDARGRSAFNIRETMADESPLLRELDI